MADRAIREGKFCALFSMKRRTRSPRKFSVLLEAARPQAHPGDWMETQYRSTAPGHFCMVGDFQQSIYRRARGPAYYRAIHDTLVADAAARA